LKLTTAWRWRDTIQNILRNQCLRKLTTVESVVNSVEDCPMKSIHSIAVASRALLLAGLPLVASADFMQPQIYQVTGISAGAHLNVRSAPTTNSADIGDLDSNVQVEVLELDASEEWGRILYNEDNGWVFMRYLQPSSLPTIRDSALPVGMLCSGTEPFWYLDLSSDEQVSLSILDSVDTFPATIDSIRRMVEWQQFPVAIRASSSNARIAAVIDNGSCTDNMTDRDYGRVIELVLENSDTSADDVSVLSGCCYLPTPGADATGADEPEAN